VGEFGSVFTPGTQQAEGFYRRPVIPLTVALTAGIALGSALPGAGAWAWAVATACAAAIAGCLIRRKAALIYPLALFIAIGYLSLQPWMQPRFPPNHVSHFVNSGPWRIVGVVDNRPLEFESRSQFVLRAECLENGSETHAVTGLLRITAIGATPSLQQGDRIALSSRIGPIRNFNNPGGFDFKRSMAFRQIYGSAFIRGEGLELLESPAASGIWGVIEPVRSAVARLIDQAGLGPEAAVLKALIIGDSSGVAPNIRQAFTRTGTSHILAISGLHISIVASIAFALLRWVLSWIPFMLRHAWTRKGAALLTLLPVTLYALVAGFSPSTQRALIMVALFLLAFLAEREGDLLNTLALAALVILCVRPAALFSISFQLSFAAVLAIVYGFERLRATPAAASSEFKDRMVQIRHGLLAFFGVSLLATWGTLPLGMYYFNSVSFIGLLANCVAIPLMGYLAVGVGLIGVLLAALSVPAAVACFQISGFMVSHAMAIMEWMAGFSFAAVRTVSPSPAEIALFYLLSWAAFYLVTGPSSAILFSNTGRRSGRTTAGWRPLSAAAEWLRGLRFQSIWRASRSRKAVWVVLAFGLIGAGFDAAYWIYQRFGRQDLRVTVIDVGQGSAVLVEFPGGGTALVDGGGFADSAAFDIGERVVAPFLWRRKIASIDTLVLTHPNSDHANGLVFIADHFHVRSLWTNGESRPIAGYGALMQTAARCGIEMPAFAELPRLAMIHGVRVEMLYPPVDFLERSRTESWRQNENNNSLVIRVSLGEVSVLIPGDIMRAAEKELVALAGDRLRSTVLIAPHHGSRSSSSEEFIRAVSPKAVLISCADRIGSGIPHSQVLQRYESARARVYRTDQQGAVQLTTDGHQVEIRPFLESN